MTATSRDARPEIHSLRTRHVVLAGVVVFLALVTALVAFGHPAGAANKGTHRYVLRPVTVTGHPAHGYRVLASNETVYCTPGSSSLSAVNRNIAWCSPNSDQAGACWRSAAPHRVLCLTDPYHHVLRSYRLGDRFPATAAPKYPKPFALTTYDGRAYLLRLGGSWSVLRDHPAWYGQFYEAHGPHTIYGPRNSDGIDHRFSTWLVTVYRDTQQHGYAHQVARVYYVGTAAGH